ncbi:hypothetical protein BD410DRAFT_838937 [Rickenella mellea]|uniref:WSC domain-containing protein n=1 Tax=Rickenella mellea TaxID=50990 RepID=A0A4Y7Q8L7_9AGAM|nr:hypothetical protein BD410DRAFT_838937 [Rickenella mellea]
MLRLFSNALVLASTIALTEATPSIPLSRRDLTIPATLPGSWQSQGCWTDTVASRTLSSSATTDTTGMTIEKCISFCGAYSYAGVEYSQECYCGNSPLAGSAAAAAGDCNMPCKGNANEPCGGPNRLNLFYSGVAPSSGPVTPLSVGQWLSQGCYTDNVNARTLPTQMGVNGNVSVETCVQACGANNFTIAGVEYAQECYCGNSFQNGGVPATDGGCTMTCVGNSTEYCGGPNRLNVYELSPWIPQGCYTDNVQARSLANRVNVNGNFTIPACLAACQSQKFTLAGVEYADECYCDNQIENGGAPATDNCNMPCAGDATTICGGPNRLNLYKLNGTIPTPTPTPTPTQSQSQSQTQSQSATATQSGTSTGPTTVPSAGLWQSLGCYNDTQAARTLTVGQGVNGQVTVESCTTACANNGYPLAGVEYAAECYCGTQISNYGAPATDGCTMACQGNANELCGGPNRLNVYNYTGTLSTTPVTTNPGNGGAGTTVSPVTSGLQTPWGYSGCYVDNANGRILSVELPDNPSVTVESCIQSCSAQNFTVAGLEYSVQCFCDNNVINGGTLLPNPSTCNMACGGNSTEACGGPNRMSIYSASTNITVLPVAQTQKTNLPGQWQYVGCLAEPGAQRVFPYQLILQRNNSATTCLSQCQAYGYPAAGMEYGDECYCGDVSDIAANGGSNATEADCSFSCSGDPIHICGGAQRMSLYEWQGTPLYTWNQPANTGHYEFLIGGLVVPLIATLGVNNKVTFVEKFGTGPPNSTGAYELDYTLANDFNHAWRTMHVKSDVFCSAGLTLPDKKGRQINVGGWSLDSTYGVRLYMPDGSPGVNGTNDWQENFNEVALQRGRWYPSAMIMANGSVLVVGGEQGSNGAPEPTLEILPNPAGGRYLTMDWLQRTDPLNLYPFLAVLPGGGVLVIYYNEARILDGGSFNTIKQLPNVPGAVNNFLGGRTYPLEGTAVLHPQHAPYTDPLTVMTCGGSIPGPAIALDNCVSITPEVDNAQWVIERMPSKRVMTCMTALPDGTFLILNGAQQGVAGFGLATEPNLQALLYDPSKPVGQRISILGTTIVDRLYHSEAILLHDGRVLVSGSDPEDTRFPQEYRIEVYVPPYLTTGLTQPTFAISNTDWAYNGQYTITITSNPNGGQIRVSLLGAVSSTHGNSMGQRTLFPAVTCAGNTCQITAPPNAHVCPPGWFQLFVLDGSNTPSYSHWVRIGGDPAGLGNWPNFPDFTLPGV